MSKKHKKNFYQSEYSSSFNWNQNDRTVSGNSLCSKPDIVSASPILNDRKVNHFRHKLKIALLEELEKLESEYMMNEYEMLDQDCVDNSKVCPKITVRTKDNISEVPKINMKSETSFINGHKHKRLKNKNHNDGDYEILRNELRRSRSMALEFKQKNESTQIWWLTESINGDSAEEDYVNYVDFPPITRAVSRKTLSPRPKYQSRSPTCKIIPRRNSFISNKISDPSQSTFSRSSFSYQKAQATGYQSTTDELSSFNHDTDTKSIEPQNNRKPCNRSDSIEGDLSKFQEANDLKLDLTVNITDNCPLLFYFPYQKEDFVKDTTSSESIDCQNKFDTYRLDEK